MVLGSTYFKVISSPSTANNSIRKGMWSVWDLLSINIPSSGELGRWGPVFLPYTTYQTMTNKPMEGHLIDQAMHWRPYVAYSLIHHNSNVLNLQTFALMKWFSFCFGCQLGDHRLLYAQFKCLYFRVELNISPVCNTIPTINPQPPTHYVYLEIDENKFYSNFQ